MRLPSRLALALSIATALASATTPAHACLNIVYRSRDVLVRLLDQSERAFDQGRPDRAVRLTGRMGMGYEAEARGLRARWSAVHGVATARVRAGIWPRGRTAVLGDDDGTGLSDLLLGEAYRAEPSPKYEQWRAEAQLQLESTHDEGMATLERLAASDLMVDAYGYAALARYVPDDRAEPYRLACVTRAGRAARRICPAERSATASP